MCIVNLCQNGVYNLRDLIMGPLFSGGRLGKGEKEGREKSPRSDREHRLPLATRREPLTPGTTVTSTAAIFISLGEEGLRLLPDPTRPH